MFYNLFFPKIVPFMR